MRLAGGLAVGARRCECLGGGFVAVGAWVPGVRELKVKFLKNTHTHTHVASEEAVAGAPCGGKAGAGGVFHPTAVWSKRLHRN